MSPAGMRTLHMHDAARAGLINNAGVQTIPDATTPEGLEVTLGVNFYGPMYLTQLLVPTLQQAARGPHSSTRIVWNASPEETLGETLWDDLKCVMSQHSPTCFDPVGSRAGDSRVLRLLACMPCVSQTALRVL
jgi:hypothetical protein